jgi:hypothetical protein
MARKKKKIKKFSAVQAVKALARERIGKLPLPRVVPDRKKRKPRKQKRTLGEMLGEE